MAQTIKHRRGKLESVKDITPINGELIIASGSDLAVHQEGLLFVGVEGNALTPSNKILTGSATIDVTGADYDHAIDGIPYYETDAKKLTILGKGGNTDVELAHGQIDFGGSTILSGSLGDIGVEDATITIAGGSGLVTTAGDFTTNQSSDETIRIHLDSGSIAGDGITAKADGSGIELDVDNSSVEVDSTNGLQVKAGGVTNAMLAGSIANGKLANSSITIAGAATSLGGSITAATIGNAIGAISESAQVDLETVQGDTDDVDEGTANLYYTEARVSANTAVAANTAKTGYTDALVKTKLNADGVISGSAQVTGIANSQIASAAAIAHTKIDFGGSGLQSGSGDIEGVTAGSGLTGGGTTGTVVVGLDSGSIAGTGLTAKTDGSGLDVSLSDFNTGDLSEGSNLYYTEARVSANTSVTANTAKTGYTDALVKTKLDADGVISGSSQVFSDVSGDVTIASNGTAAIGSGVIVNADINSSAAIAHGKLDLGGSTLLSGSLGDIGVEDATITLTGGSGINTLGDFSTNQGTDEEFKVSIDSGSLAGNGLNAKSDGSGLEVDLAANKGLEFASGELQIKLDGSTLALGTSGIKVSSISNTEVASNAAIAYTKLDLDASGIVSGSGQVDGASITNNSVTIGSTAVALNASSTTLAGLTGLDFTAADASIAASIGANTLTLGGSTSDIVVAGNLTVQGTTTTVDSTNVTIGDNILELNYGGSATEGGIYVKDGTGSNTASGSLVWDSTNDYWKAGPQGSEAEVTRFGADPTTNKIQKANANGLLVDSVLTDDGTDATFSGDVTVSGLTASRVVVTDGSSKLATSTDISALTLTLDGGTF